ncbi:L-seryl-tRNA(Sec) selenium transferase [bacterium HR36]|uniref:L-seryl-tRNA(Sec) selenium transferase n=1 Tax=uncultured Planctomycetota bacterium TaxID=120965 RepID=H5SJP8_9BACT|nr:selenocysteine synthase [uncultured Planctomycetota bacterium]GBD35611.1 L-seryl-tRNA(Sec) selenium transferase [bacterium HR36]
MAANPYRQLPAVHEVLNWPEVQTLLNAHAAELVTEVVRQEIAELRQRIRRGETPDWDAERQRLPQRIRQRLQQADRPWLRPVINATGILLHTNLGRAPLAESAVQAVCQAARGYVNLEMDLESGERSSRQDVVRRWLTRLLPAESATAVNNNAAATVLVLRALAQGREVIVSRGELVEIGGSFRLPEIMQASGAVLREVGTTNITRLSDYAQAITPATALILRVHRSNFVMRGHTSQPSLEDLVKLAHERELWLVDDIGSGALADYSRWGFRGEPSPAESLRLGADLVLFSGDKLLGGPQAGLIAGRRELIQRIEKDPLMRAFRLDKMTLAALEATLRLYLDPAQALHEVPILRLLSQSLEQLRRRARRIAAKLRSLPLLRQVQVREDRVAVGGGSLPEQTLPTIVIAVKPQACTDAELAQRLRTSEPPLVPRIQDGCVLLDLRSVFPEQDALLVKSVTDACTIAKN